MPTTDMLKASEAAVVASVSLREINRAIDEHLLPDNLVSVDNGRHVFGWACALISFYFESAKRLTAEERMLIIRSAEPRLRNLDIMERSRNEDWIIRRDFLSVDLKPFIENAIHRLELLDTARRIVSMSEDVMGGTPVIAGTRIPIYDIAAMLSSGIPREEILEDYPALDDKTLDLVKVYADANPLRGRPKPSPIRLPEGLRVVSERKVAGKGR